MTTHRSRSPVANAFLAILGGLFVAAGVILAVWLLVQTWGYASRLEFALALVLLACTAFGGYLIAIARGFELPIPHHRRRPHHRTS